jgi:hypothetical protein
LQSTKSSLIFQNFFFSSLITNKCNSCGVSNCEYKFEKAIELRIDLYKQMKNAPVTVNECLKYYTSGMASSCQNCKQNNAIQSRLFFNTGRVLIFNLIKNNNN